MRKIAAWLVFSGLIFAFFSLPFAGTDLLIDAVGFLLVWNGVRALQKKDAVYGFAAACSLVLVGVAVLQLFLTSMGGWVLAGLRLAAEGLLCWQLFAGFARLGAKWRGVKASVVAYSALGVCLAGIAAGLVQCPLLFLGWAVHPALSALVWAAKTAALALVGAFAIWFGRQPE